MKKILLIQTAFIGDAILVSSAVESINKSAPQTEIHLLVRKGNESLYTNHPFLKKTWVWDKSKKYSSLWHLIRSLRKERFDVAVNFQRFFTSGLITIFSKAKQTRGFKKNPLSLFFSKSFTHELGKKGDPNYLHEVDRNYSLLADMFPVLHRKPVLYPSEDDFQKINKYQNKKYLTLSPASVWFTKQWPKAKWIELIKQHQNLQIYLLGAPSDLLYLNEIKSACEQENIEVLAGNLSLLQSAALMKNAQMNYVNDSAPLHLSSSVNAAVTAIFCSTIPEFGFGPLSDNHVIWQTKSNLACQPCGIHGFKSCPKGHFKCSEI